MSVSNPVDLPVRSTAAQNTVDRIIELGSAVHAVMFYGCSKWQVRQLASQLAARWLEIERDFETGALSGPRLVDLLWITPTGASRIIKVNQMTSTRGDDEKVSVIPLKEFLRTGPLQANFKVVIIEEPERLNSEAGNAILKVLEEPPHFAKIVLTTTNVRSLQPTIISRCLSVACEAENTEASRPIGSWREQWQLEELRPILDDLWDFAKRLPSRPMEEALVASEELRAMAEAIQKSLDTSARTANALVVELLGDALQNLVPEWTSVGSLVSEAHRRIVGNGNSSIVVDSLLTSLLAD